MPDITETGSRIVLTAEEYAELKKGIEDRDFMIGTLKRKEGETRRIYIKLLQKLESAKGNLLSAVSDLIFLTTHEDVTVDNK